MFEGNCGRSVEVIESQSLGYAVDVLFHGAVLAAEQFAQFAHSTAGAS